MPPERSVSGWKVLYKLTVASDTCLFCDQGLLEPRGAIHVSVVRLWQKTRKGIVIGYRLRRRLEFGASSQISRMRSAPVYSATRRGGWLAEQSSSSRLLFPRYILEGCYMHTKKGLRTSTEPWREYRTMARRLPSNELNRGVTLAHEH